MWRDFANIFCTEEGKWRPGVVNWIILLKQKKLLDRTKGILFKTASVKYGDKDFFAIDVFGDYLRLQTGLFTEHGNAWEREIQNEVALCDRAAGIVGILMKNLNLASGQDTDTGVSAVKEDCYYLIDQPFREWISEISGEDELARAGELRLKWREKAYQIVKDYGRKLFYQAGEQAMIGHTFKDEKDNKIYRTSFDAWNIFISQITGCYELGHRAEQRKEDLHE